MATMKDVAKLAGVSHGTVSNIINGTKGVNIEKIRRVEEAMKAIGYKPNNFARSLKTNRSMQIDVILPNILDFAMAQLFTTISHIAANHNYEVRLCITNEVSELESEMLNRAMMSKRDGIILMTCQPDNQALFQNQLDSGMKIVFVQRQVEGPTHCFTGFNIAEAFKGHVAGWLRNGCRRIALVTGPAAYTSESACIEAYRAAHEACGAPIDPAYLEITNNDRESAMKSAVRLLQMADAPELIFATNALLAEGIRKATDLLDARQTRIAYFTADTWSYTENGKDTAYPLPYTKLAEEACRMLLEGLNSPEPGSKTLLLEIPPTDSPGQSVPRPANPSRCVRALMLDSEAAYATEALLPEFQKRTGIRAEIEKVRYEDFYPAIKAHAATGKYDVYQVDIPWLNEFAGNGILSCLDGYIERSGMRLDDIPEGVIRDFSASGGRMYALPYMYCAQLLFYRNDLFTSVKNRRLFFEQTKSELHPPRTWAEFNTVARFFTQKYNPDSETPYGTTLGSRMTSGAVCEYLPRLWGFGGAVFEDGNVVLDSREAIRALNNYCESFSYASETSCDHWWGEQAREFCAGRAAMMILFDAHATDITDRSKSSVVGKTGFDLVPGKTSLLGGWSLGMDSATGREDEAFAFIRWACSSRTCIPNTILGGSPPCVQIYESNEIASIHPWHRKAFDASRHMKKRILPPGKDGACISEHTFEQILGSAVYRAVTGREDAKTALSRAANELRQYFE